MQIMRKSHIRRLVPISLLALALFFTLSACSGQSEPTAESPAPTPGAALTVEPSSAAAPSPTPATTPIPSLPPEPTPEATPVPTPTPEPPMADTSEAASIPTPVATPEPTSASTAADKFVHYPEPEEKEDRDLTKEIEEHKNEGPANGVSYQPGELIWIPGIGYEEVGGVKIPNVTGDCSVGGEEALEHFRNGTMGVGDDNIYELMRRAAMDHENEPGEPPNTEESQRPTMEINGMTVENQAPQTEKENHLEPAPPTQEELDETDRMLEESGVYDGYKVTEQEEKDAINGNYSNPAG